MKIDNKGIRYNESIISDRDGFKGLILRKLRENPNNFLENHRHIKKKVKEGVRYHTSGVILLLRFSEKEGQYEFVLTKRSMDIVQPGDLCCPGGHISLRDKIQGIMIANGLNPFIRGVGVASERRSAGYREFKITANYLATALREAREETGLNSGNVEYLGTLSPYSLESFRRVIYPSVGIVKGKWKERLNWEVEKTVSISLKDMFIPENYFWITFDVPEDIKKASHRNEWNFPSFVSGKGSQREILWGATFNIILSFLRIVFDFSIPEIPPEKIIYKEIPESYFTGRFNRMLKAGLKREKK